VGCKYDLPQFFNGNPDAKNALFVDTHSKGIYIVDPKGVIEKAGDIFEGFYSAMPLICSPCPAQHPPLHLPLWFNTVDDHSDRYSKESPPGHSSMSGLKIFSELS